MELSEVGSRPEIILGMECAEGKVRPGSMRSGDIPQW